MFIILQIAYYNPPSYPSWLAYYGLLTFSIISIVVFVGVFIGAKVWREAIKPRDEIIADLKEERLILTVEKRKDEEYKDSWFEAFKAKGMALGIIKFQQDIFGYMEGSAKANFLERTTEITILENENLRRQVSSTETELAERSVLQTRLDVSNMEVRNENAKLRNRIIEIKEQSNDLLDSALRAIEQAKALNAPSSQIAKLQLEAEGYARKMNIPFNFDTKLPSIEAPNTSVSDTQDYKSSQINGKTSVSHAFHGNETDETEIRFVGIEGMEVADAGGYAVILYKDNEYILPYQKMKAGVPFILSNSPLLYATLCGCCEKIIKITYKEAKFCSDSCKNKHNNKRR